MLAQSSQLGQLRPANVAANNAYTADIETEITLVMICNTTGVDRRFSIYHDDDGTTFTDDTALYRNELVQANGTVVIELMHAGGGISVAEGGSVAVQSDLASALNFTLYGITTRTTGQ